MIAVGIKPLLGRLNEHCRKSLEASAGMCVARSHYEITVEHVIRQMADEPSSDFGLILGRHGVNVQVLKNRLNTALENFSTGNSARPVFSPRLIEWYQDAMLVSSVELAENRIRSGALLLALLNRSAQFVCDTVGECLKALPREKILEGFCDLAESSVEQDRPQAAERKKSQGDSALETYGEDVTEKARQGLIDPVFGRDQEIRQVVDIFARRRKNNPILVGEPGVGKTAVVEGLALRIVQGDVPDFLKSVRLVNLDLGLLQAGAGVKGEFENRLKKIIGDVRNSPEPVILFIDEAHTLVGAGASAGGSDAANLLKPALARGELRTIAATTWSEYKRYFEKDAALTRRFQLVHLEEPSVEDTILILRGLRKHYEKAHGVVIRDDAVRAAAELSSRYISGRYLPDKAIDLLDTGAARVKVQLTGRPSAIENTESLLQACVREQEALLRDTMYGGSADSGQLETLASRIEALTRERDHLIEGWQREKALVHTLVELRQKLYAGENPACENGNGDPAGDLKRAIGDLTQELNQAQAQTPLVSFEVEPQTIARVVSDWTGIPSGQMMHDEARRLMDMETCLKERVKGQDQALSEISRIIRASKTGLRDPAQPLGVFLLTGPSGVGKTETGLATAELLFGGERFTATVNMSEFQEKHTVSRLIGSPPGYVGYGEGGVLTEAVRQRPYSVVLLDEAEKANPEVLNLFYQVFDKGVLADGEGRNISFRNSVIFMTSNLGADAITHAFRENPELGSDEVSSLVRPVLAAHFKPALLARMTVVPFRPLSRDTLKDIVAMKLCRVADRLTQAHAVSLVFDREVETDLTERCLESDSGARNIDHLLAGTLLPLVSQAVLDGLSRGALPPDIRIVSDGRGGFEIGAEKKGRKKRRSNKTTLR